MDHERTLSTSPFPGDDGRATAATRAALSRALAPSSPTDYLRAVAALCTDRVLVPVVATATRVGVAGAGPSTGPGDGAGSGRGEAPGSGEAAGLASDKEAEMSVVLLQTHDGRRAMLTFTGLDALQAWDATARPVPVTLDLAAQSAAADGAAALLVDFAGPHPLVIEGEVLAELAQGHRLVELSEGQFGWAVVRQAPATPTE